MTHQERMEAWGELAGHVIATILIVGFLGLAYVTFLGFVELDNPTVAGFVGTVLGVVGAKIEPPIVRYFGRHRIEETKRDKV